MRVTNEISSAIGSRKLIEGESIGTRYYADWTGVNAARPLAVVLPASTEDVAETLRICNSFGQSVVPQGGMTGLSGGATPTGGDMCLSLDRMHGVQEIDESAATMTVLAGTTLQEIQEAAGRVGLDFPIDMGSRAGCQIGGVIATNAGGIRVLQSGTAREQVLGLEVVLADGTVLTSLNEMIKNNTGYDLKHWFIGSEGTLGVITRAVLRLRPKPRNRQTALCAMEDYDGALRLLKSLRARLGPDLAAFELMWADFFEFGLSAARTATTPFDKVYKLYALVERTDFDRSNSRSGELAECLWDAVDANQISDAVIAHSSTEAKSLWDIRECTSEFPSRLQPINFDISLPIGNIGEFVRQCKSLFKSLWPNHQSLFFGHIGDSNLHVTVDGRSIPAEPHGTVERTLYSLLEQFQGSVSAEHGIGALKKEYISYSRTQAELQTMRAIKNTLDPRGIMNPGKLWPSAAAFNLG